VNRIPLDYDASWLVQASLDTISVSRYSVILDFDSGTGTLTIECDTRVINGDRVRSYSYPRDAAVELLPLLLQTVANATVESATELAIDFSDGTRLMVVDSSDHYESFTLSRGDDLLVV
jgi:hypothetical protein